MKKLGIITFHRALNYGAVLQAYAMKYVCGSLGYEAHVVDYAASPADDGPHPVRAFINNKNKKRGLLRLGRDLMSFPWDRKRWRAFRQFREEELDESRYCSDVSRIADLRYDAYISGSDQIWNYNITGNEFDPVFFGDIPGDHVCVVYGASAQDTPFPLDKELQLKHLLMETEAAVGIREQSLTDYAGKLTGVRFPTVLDPTLLAGREAFEDMAGAQAGGEPYILIYQIDTNPVSDISVKTLEDRYRCKVYTMTVPRIGSLHGRKGYESPQNFLALVKHARFLVTNSFHGVAFSLLFHKQFFVYENGGVMSRIDGLLDAVGLHDRKVTMVSDINEEQTIDYRQADDRLSVLRERSMSFLKDALNGTANREPFEERPETILPLSRREKKDCSGCTACAEVCPTGAISMEPDEEGFFYPAVDSERCIACGLCDRFCSFQPVPRREENNLPAAFGVKHRNLLSRRTSRSGGAFIALSDETLKQQGVIYGAAMAADGTVSHIRAESAEDRDRMKDAKYVQSDLGGIFAQAADDLRADRKVLFSGTPCQVAGLRFMLSEKRIPCDNLITCDLVCHGVPSPRIWEDYLLWIRKTYHSPIRKAVFRDKSFGWDTHCESFLLENGKKIVSRDFTDLFYEHLILRPSCHHCHFANVNRISDITLGDFWGIEKNAPDFADNQGVSLVLINTTEGQALFHAAAPALEYIACDIRNCMQPTLYKPSRPSPGREAFWAKYRQDGFEEAMKKFVQPAFSLPRMKRKIKKILYKLHLRAHP